jgi:hypothetical protein
VIHKSRSARRFLLALTLSLSCTGAVAESEDSKERASSTGTVESRSAEAERLFQEGVLEMKLDRCESAVQKFTASNRLDPSAAALINLATCEARRERPAAAVRAYQTAIRQAKLEASEDLLERAQRAISVLSAKVSTLRVVAPVGVVVTSVSINGRVIGNDEELKVLDPGDNTVVIGVRDGRVFRRHATATATGTTVVLELPAPPKPTEKSVSAPSFPWRTVAILTTGVGAASLVAGLAVSLNADRVYKSSAPFCRENNCTPTGVELRRAAFDRAEAATYLVGIGAAGVALGVGLFFLRPSWGKARVGVTPWLSPGYTAGGVSLDVAL